MIIEITIVKHTLSIADCYSMLWETLLYVQKCILTYWMRFSVDLLRKLQRPCCSDATMCLTDCPELFTGKVWTWWRACLGCLRWASMSRWSSCSAFLSSTAQTCWCWHCCRSPPPGTHCAMSSSLPWCLSSWATTLTLPLSCTTPGMDRLVLMLVGFKSRGHYFVLCALWYFQVFCCLGYILIKTCVLIIPGGYFSRDSLPPSVS